RLLPAADLLVNPSFREEMPNVVLEAMAFGVPVVATSVGGVPEIAGEIGACRLVPLRDPPAISREIVALSGSEAKRHALGQAGLDRIRSRFSPAVQKQQLRDFYADVVPWLSFKSAPADSPKISVVLPVRNEEAHIGAVISALESQDYPADR